MLFNKLQIALVSCLCKVTLFQPVKVIFHHFTLLYCNLFVKLICGRFLFVFCSGGYKSSKGILFLSRIFLKKLGVSPVIFLNCLDKCATLL